MFSHHSTKIRGEFHVSPATNLSLSREGLSCEISVITETEFDLDTELDEDFHACEIVSIVFCANRAGWTKAYRRLRQQFKQRIECCDKKPADNLKTRLRHKKMINQFRGINQGVTACA